MQLSLSTKFTILLFVCELSVFLYAVSVICKCFAPQYLYLEGLLSLFSPADIFLLFVKHYYYCQISNGITTFYNLLLDAIIRLE